MGGSALELILSMTVLSISAWVSNEHAMQKIQYVWEKELILRLVYSADKTDFHLFSACFGDKSLLTSGDHFINAWTISSIILKQRKSANILWFLWSFLLSKDQYQSTSGGWQKSRKSLHPTKRKLFLHCGCLFPFSFFFLLSLSLFFFFTHLTYQM